METIICKSEEEANKAIHDAKERGLQLACISNAGLITGQARLTFLPDSAFIKEKNHDK